MIKKLGHIAATESDCAPRTHHDEINRLINALTCDVVVPQRVHGHTHLIRSVKRDPVRARGHLHNLNVLRPLLRVGKRRRLQRHVIVRPQLQHGHRNRWDTVRSSLTNILVNAHCGHTHVAVLPRASAALAERLAR